MSGSVGVCVETTPDTAIASRTTTNYYQGVSCIDGTATGEYHAVAAGTTATVGLNFTWWVAQPQRRSVRHAVSDIDLIATLGHVPP